jgi:hypothetical protein
MLVYQVAREYDSYDLETYAKKYIEMFGESMSIFDIMEAAREVYSKLPKDETWLDKYINKQLRIVFSTDTNIFQREEFYLDVGKDSVFDNTVMRMVVNIYSEVLPRQVTETITEGGVAEEGAVEDGAEEEDVAEEAVNFEVVRAEPSGSTLSFEWGENWVSSSHLGLVLRDTGNRNMEKDVTNLWYSENKAERPVGFSAPSKETKSRKGKGKKKKNNNRKDKINVAEPVPE